MSDYIELLEGRILALARAHDQITQDNWGPAPLRQLFETEIAQYIARGQVTLSDTPAMLEPLAFSTVALVAHELVTNAVKYGALSSSGHIAIGWTIDEAGDLSLSWLESGGPAVAKPRRQGLGTTIIELSIPHELGGLAKTTFDSVGFRANFLIPARHVRMVAPAEHAPHDPATLPAPVPDDDFPTLDGPVLLVEDGLLIAIHVEDILKQIGVTRVVTAPTVAAAFAELRVVRPVVAVLDINLGEEDSLPVADRLLATGIPFVFATGYGEKLILPEQHANVCTLQKPYTKANLAAALRRAVQGGAPAAPLAMDGV